MRGLSRSNWPILFVAFIIILSVLSLAGIFGEAPSNDGTREVCRPVEESGSSAYFEVYNNDNITYVSNLTIIEIIENSSGEVIHQSSKSIGNQTGSTLPVHVSSDITEPGDYIVEVTLTRDNRTVDQRIYTWSVQDNCDHRMADIHGGSLSEIRPIGGPS